MAAIACVGWQSTAEFPSRMCLSEDDKTAAFQAAGFTRHGEQWRGCDDPGTLSYRPGTIDDIRDLNGDGEPEVVITEGGTYCYGFTGTGFSVVSRQPDGTWKLIVNSIGIPLFLDERGVGGWPDISVGGPGFCFPVLRWNGRAYLVDRHQYEGAPCRPD